MKRIIVFDKGGRKERIILIKQKKAPRDFFQGIDLLPQKGFDVVHLTSSRKYPKELLYIVGSFFEKIFSKLSNIGIRPLSVYQFRKEINKSNYILSLTDGFSLSLGFYYSFINKKSKVKLAGAFHRLSDYDSKLILILRKLYYQIFLKILNRLDYIIFYGNSDRLNAIKEFKIPKEKTFILKFGVDTDFWVPKKNNAYHSNYIFSIGQDPARDFQTLLKIKTKKKIHIHTSLLKEKNETNIKITNGSYQEHNNSFSDIDIRSLYQKAFAVVVPLKDVFQPSGYSVTLQAMACGKPVILSKTRGLWAPKVFKNLSNCILVKPYESDSIEKAINFLESNKSEYDKISLNARKTAEKYFSLNISTASTFDLFKNFN